MPAERLDPESPQSRVLGLLSKRREVNARWKYFKHQLDKTLFPLQITYKQLTPDNQTIHHTEETTLKRVGARGIGLQGAGVFEELEALASPPAVIRLENRHAEDDGDDTRQIPRPAIRSHLPRRFLRRRFQETLTQIPVLNYMLPHKVPNALRASSDKEPGTQSSLGKPSRFHVALSRKARTQLGPIQSIADEADVAWIQRAQRTGNEDVKSK